MKAGGLREKEATGDADHAWLQTGAQVVKPVLESCLWQPWPAISQGIILHSFEVGVLQ